MVGKSAVHLCISGDGVLDFSQLDPEAQQVATINTREDPSSNLGQGLESPTGKLHFLKLMQINNITETTWC